MEENRLPTAEVYHKKVAATDVSGEKLNFKGEFSCNVSFRESTFKSKVYVLHGTSNLFGTDWNALFDLWELFVNSFYKKVDVAVMEKSEKNRKIYFRHEKWILTRVFWMSRTIYENQG